MPVVFEDENFSFNGQNSQSAKYEEKMKRKKDPATQFLMVVIIIVCLIGAYILPSYLNPDKTTEIIYAEDITEARMRLIPEEERANYINSLPSRKNN